jgi:NAD(P) transhydrogenase subunit alpha
MLVIDGGFVRPVRMAAFGADAASLQAIATARRLGALTYAFAFTDEERRKNERLGAKVLAAYPSLAMTGAGQSSPHRAALRRQLAGHLAQMQLIVTSVGDSMRAAPLLLDEETMSSLAAGTVVIDLAASRGGNCSLTRVDEVVTANGVRVLGLTTFASHEAKEASRLFGKGMRSVLERLVGDDGRVRLDGPDPILARLLASLSRGTRIAC